MTSNIRPMTPADADAVARLLPDLGYSATPAQVAQLVSINADSRLRALQIGLLVLAGVSAIGILPVSRLPRYRPGEIPELHGAPERVVHNDDEDIDDDAQIHRVMHGIARDLKRAAQRGKEDADREH